MLDLPEEVSYFFGMEYENLVEKISAEIPGFEVRFKDESWFMKLLGVLLYVFNPRFMDAYTTTLYPYVYFPGRTYLEENRIQATKILAHEFVHLWDAKKKRIRFSLEYLFPQILAVVPLAALFVLAFFSLPGKPWILVGLGLLTVVLLLPWPARFRERYEIRGYAMTLALVSRDYVGHHAASVLSNFCGRLVRQQFTSWAYYKMSWDGERTLCKLLGIANNLLDGKLPINDRPYQVLLGGEHVPETESEERNLGDGT